MTNLPTGRRRLFLRPRITDAITRWFGRLYFYRQQATVFGNRFLGVQTLKYPNDLWIYQEIICETQPDVVVETGTWHGGSALYLATIFDAIDHGRVISVDLQTDDALPTHARVTYITASSTDSQTIAQVKGQIDDDERVMVILDSLHTRDHVLAELEAYSDIVTPGCYLVVEDTNVNGHPLLPEHGPGPGEALSEFLGRDTRFEVDRSRERLLLTANPAGYLRRLPG